MTKRPIQEEPRPPESFVLFQKAVKHLLTVSKKDIDDRLAEDRAKRNGRKSLKKEPPESAI